MKDRITRLVRAGFAGIYLVTSEEARAEIEISRAAGELGYDLYAWSVTEGLVNPASGPVRDIFDPAEAAACLGELPEKSILMLKDYHQFLGDDAQPASPVVTRTLRDEIRRAGAGGRAAVITACRKQLPPEISREFTVLEFELPDTGILEGIARGLCESAGIEAGDDMVAAAAGAARGLTVTEAENTMALSIVACGKPDPGFIASEKARAIGHDGILEITGRTVDPESVGGLDVLKSWLTRRRHAFTREAAEFGLPAPRGVLILGIPGTGKSLTAKAASSILGKPVLRLDAGKLFAGIVGESEANLRRALQTAEAVAPCILWIDEIEKGFSGSGSSNTADGGTSSRVFGSFLSWMQEKNSPVFVVATANDISQLPPELLRRGRFDEIFFVDLPGESARDAIWRIHIGGRGRNPDDFDLEKLVGMTGGFTGSEIEQAVIDALFECFDDGRELDDRALAGAAGNSVPLSVTGRESVESLRKWAASRARPADTPGKAGKSGMRRIAA